MVNIGLIGLGGWGKNHVRVLNELKVLSGICDVNNVTLEYYSKKYKINGYTSVNELIHNEKLDGIVVATPVKTHYKIASNIITNKLPIFIEKPITDNYIEAKKLIELSKINNVKVMMGYIERFNPVLIELKAILDRDDGQNPILINFNRLNKIDEKLIDVGIIMDTAVHDIDLARWLFKSEPKMIFAQTRKVQSEKDNLSFIQMEFKNKGIALITSSWISKNKMRKLELLNNNSTIDVDYIKQTININNNQISIEGEEPLLNEIKHFISSLKNNTKPKVTIEDGVKTTRIAEAATISSKTGTPMFLDV